MEKIQLALEKARRQTPELILPPVAPAARPAADVTAASAGTIQMPVAWRRRGIVAAERTGKAANAIRVLRTRLIDQLERRAGRALAVCSARRGAGQSLIAANLAVSIAQYLHRHVLLVDLDLQRPAIQSLLGLTGMWGLSDYLTEAAPLADCIVASGVERLSILPQIRPVANSSELLATPRMAALARELAGGDPSRIVVLDCPPLLATDDALVALHYATGCLLVVPEGRVSREDVVRAAELIGEDRFLGSVLNDARWHDGKIV